jgi:hypothetical protein
MQNNNPNVNIIDLLKAKNELNTPFGVLYEHIKIPIKAKPYEHQIAAVVFALGIWEGGDGIDCCDKLEKRT